MKKLKITALIVPFFALLLGFGLQQLLVAQEGCCKCCGNSRGDSGTRTSYECPEQTCYWTRCNNHPMCGEEYGIECNPTDECSYCMDTCFADYGKCPADENVFGACTRDCEYSE